jgi:hypothetical protein
VLNKIKKSILLLFVVSGTLAVLLPNTAYANPSITIHDSSPTAHDAHAGVDDPANAYDGATGTYARIAFDKSEYEEVKTFSTSGAPTTKEIAFVDFKMNYKSDSGGSGENYRIVYYVGTAGPIVLQDWIGDGVAYDYTSPERVWLKQSEPNDGVWSWADITDIRLRVEGGTGAGGAAYFFEYEAWVTVTAYSKGTMSVSPASSTDPSSPFTVDIDIASVDDLYGWEFKLYYNNTILSNSTVSEGTFLSNQGTTAFLKIDNTDTYNATHGRFWYTCTLTGDTQGASGSGTLASIEFTVDGPGGTTALHLVDTKLVGYEFSGKKLIEMNHFTTDGSVTISGVPEFPLGVALEISLVGVIVYIWWRGKRKHPSRMLNTVNMPPQ